MPYIILSIFFVIITGSALSYWKENLGIYLVGVGMFAIAIGSIIAFVLEIFFGIYDAQ
jgi:hypothetical protein